MRAVQLRYLQQIQPTAAHHQGAHQDPDGDRVRRVQPENLQYRLAHEDLPRRGALAAGGPATQRPAPGLNPAVEEPLDVNVGATSVL